MENEEYIKTENLQENTWFQKIVSKNQEVVFRFLILSFLIEWKSCCSPFVISRFLWKFRQKIWFNDRCWIYWSSTTWERTLKIRIPSEIQRYLIAVPRQTNPNRSPSHLDEHDPNSQNWRNSDCAIQTGASIDSTCRRIKGRRNKDRHIIKDVR